MILVAEKLHRFLPTVDSPRFNMTSHVGPVPLGSSNPQFAVPCLTIPASSDSTPSTYDATCPSTAPMETSWPYAAAPGPASSSSSSCKPLPPLSFLIDSPRSDGAMSPSSLPEPSSPLPVSFGGFGSFHDEEMQDAPQVPDLHTLSQGGGGAEGSSNDSSFGGSDCGSDSFSWSSGKGTGCEPQEDRTQPASPLPVTVGSGSSIGTGGGGANAPLKPGYRPVHVIHGSNGSTLPVRPTIPPLRLVAPLSGAGHMTSPNMLSPSVMSQFLATGDNDRIVRRPSTAPATGRVVAVQQRDVSVEQLAAGQIEEERPWRGAGEEAEVEVESGAAAKATGSTWKVAGWLRQMAGWNPDRDEASQEQLLAAENEPWQR
eukprot:TRINITY_DN69841_c0_g1_i1.p1 TRINITY_DN69841_c0_g1~~TRINITY_DN69841_c0_g1_i1.p1  ORF type:complete len:372 (-),score=-15.13 TRINITY_DN69841_c0_g1_i1:195-1310(-)